MQHQHSIDDFNTLSLDDLLVDGVDYSRLPERVRRVLDGAGAAPAACCRCRRPASLRCTRCRVAKYCSAGCQREHFPFHKRGCKSISKQRDIVERELKEKNYNVPITGNRDDWHGFQDGMSYLLTMEKMTSLADSLVKIGYRESDTIANGALYYREALKYYIMPREYISQEYHEYMFRFDDRVLLLLFVLGGDCKTIQEWCTRTGSLRASNYFIPRDIEDYGEEAIGFGLEGYARDDLIFQVILFLCQMKMLGQCRRDRQRLEVYRDTIQNAVMGYAGSMEDILNHVSPFLMGVATDGRIELEALPDGIRCAFNAIRYHGNGGCLIHLRESVPFTRNHAPALFCGVDDASAPDEFWMLLKDYIFETPGLNDIFHEFYPEISVGRDGDD